jgi:hypothetical protein
VKPVDGQLELVFQRGSQEPGIRPRYIVTVIVIMTVIYTKVNKKFKKENKKKKKRKETGMEPRKFFFPLLFSFLDLSQ